MKLTTQLYIFLITVLAVCLYIQCEDDRNSVYCVEEEVTADTVVIFRTDTITEYVFKVVEKKTIDTVYIETENKPFLALPVVSKHFAKENLYDLWISGYKDVFLDSMRVYISKKETLIEKEKNIYVTPKKEVFIGGGFIYNNKKILPTVSVSQRVNKKTFISYSFGYNDGFYGSLDLNIKIK